jgi:hypothetical protein
VVVSAYAVIFIALIFAQFGACFVGKNQAPFREIGCGFKYI